MNGYDRKRVFLLIQLVLLFAASFRSAAAQNFDLRDYSYRDADENLMSLRCEPGEIQGSGSSAFFQCTAGDEVYLFYSDTQHTVRLLQPDTEDYSTVLGTGWQQYESINAPIDAVRYDSTATSEPTPSITDTPTKEPIDISGSAGISEITPYPTETSTALPTVPSAIETVRQKNKTPIILWIVAIIVAAMIGALFYLSKRPVKKEKTITRTETIPDDEPDTISINTEQAIKYSFGNLQSQGTRDYQEDSFCFSDTSDTALVARQGFIAVLADGMGGLKKGKETSQLAVSLFRETFKGMNVDGDIPAQLRDSVIQINKAIFKADQQESGTTFIAVHFYKDRIFWISVGDSIVWLFRNGRLYQLNREHNHLNDMRLQFMHEEISKTQLQSEPKLRALTSNLGRRDLQEIDQNLIAFPLKKGDRILLCSDGVSGRLSLEEITLAMKQDTAQKSCNMLGRMVQQKNSQNQDNYTAQVICCD